MATGSTMTVFWIFSLQTLIPNQHRDPRNTHPHRPKTAFGAVSRYRDMRVPSEAPPMKSVKWGIGQSGQ